jgi:hypothetical protein
MSMIQMKGQPHSLKKLSKAQDTHCTSHTNTGKLQHPTLIVGQIPESETKQRQVETNRSYEPNGFNR